MTAWSECREKIYMGETTNGINEVMADGTPAAGAEAVNGTPNPAAGADTINVGTTPAAGAQVITAGNDTGNAGNVSGGNTQPAESAKENDKEYVRENVKEEPEAGKAGKRGWFTRFLLCCLSFAAVTGLVNLVYFALKLEPFGTGAVSIDDAKIQYIDFFTYYVDVLRGTRSLTYDFGNMLGGSSLGLFSYYLASPFNLLLYFFGKKGVYRFFDIAVSLKLGTAGATFCWYLQRRFEDRIRPALLLALSMGYGLMQYSVAQSSNIMWLDGVYMLPLMLLGVYEVIHRKSVWRLVLATAFCILCNWYIGGLNCLFTGFWFLFEFFFCERAEERRQVVTEHNYPARGGYSREEASGFMVGITDLILSA